MDALKKEVADGTSSKKRNKQLWAAYEVAAEGHDLDYFKQLLKEHEQAIEADVQAAADAAAAAEVKKAEKKSSKKSISAAGGDDVEMEDADSSSAKKKPSKKRKKSDETDGEEKVCLFLVVELAHD